MNDEAAVNSKAPATDSFARDPASPFGAPNGAPAAAVVEAEVVADSPATFWTDVEAKLDHVGDWLNPILVKETRQALKSKQFSVTFALLLLLGWFWTAIFVILTVPTVYYVPMGPYILGGYGLVLTIPMLIVVPYAAFRSLAAELEDGTFEMLSITSLGARHIVLGKLGSAIVQMIVYYSALAPCVAFTYLLRGLDILTILHVLGYTFLASIMLSIFGLMLATVTRSRHWQVVLSVLFVIVLLVSAFVGNVTLFSILAASAVMIYDQFEFWIYEATLLSFYLAYCALFVQISAGQISFTSENRSTPVRYILFLIQLLIIGWCTYYSVVLEVTIIFVVLWSTLHWIIAGLFLTGELSQLSPRALRSLPQTVLGRMFLTWFNPGSATGYVFASTCLLSVLLITLGYATFAPIYVAFDDPFSMLMWHPAMCMVGYTLFYLGFSRLLVVGCTKIGLQASMLIQVIVQLLIAFLACLLPALFQIALERFDFDTIDYTILQAPNWMWTMSEAFDGGLENDHYFFSFWGWHVTMPMVVLSAGIGMYLLHLFLAAKETEKQRLAAPQRVREEDAELGKDRRPALIEI